MFINLTNHPAGKWDAPQLAAAQEYGEITDIAFPQIEPMATSAEVTALAQEYAGRIAKMKPKAVLCQGEYTFVYAAVAELKRRGIVALSACSKRCVSEIVVDGAAKKVVDFRFVQFREY